MPVSPSLSRFCSMDLGFVAHRSELDEVCSKLAQPGTTLCVTGMPGIGKTYLARQYAHHVCETSPETWVFWIRANTQSTFEDDFVAIADLVKVAGRYDRDPDLFELVSKWLCRKSRLRWVIILDDLDDGSFLVNKSSQMLRGRARRERRRLLDYIPQHHNGSVLLTSRDTMAHRTFGHGNNTIRLNGMDPTHGAAFLNHLLYRNTKEDELVGLADTLGYLPLAMVQASGFLNRDPHGLTVENYTRRIAEGLADGQWENRNLPNDTGNDDETAIDDVSNNNFKIGAVVPRPNFDYDNLATVMEGVELSYTISRNAT